MTSLRKFRIRVSKAINLERPIKKTKPAGTPKEKILNPLGALHDHLLVTPPFHFKPHKVGGWIERFL